MSLLQEKYKAYHAGLPVTVAETLLRTDPQIELPLWLVHMFKVIFVVINGYLKVLVFSVYNIAAFGLILNFIYIKGTIQISTDILQI